MEGNFQVIVVLPQTFRAASFNGRLIGVAIDASEACIADKLQIRGQMLRSSSDEPIELPAAMAGRGQWHIVSNPASIRMSPSFPSGSELETEKQNAVLAFVGHPEEDTIS